MSRGRGRHHHDLRAIAVSAMVEHGLAPEPPAAALAELQSIRGPATAGARTGARGEPAVDDLRDRPWCSIDNDDSRDLDQLTVAVVPAPDRRGAVTFLVAVSDVDALVPRGSPIDGHARHNTTSVYTAGGVFPMLPEKLSTDLTSLNEGEDRLAVVVEMTVNPRGAVESSRVGPALVRNRAKLAYGAVAAWLDGAAPPPPKLAAVPGLEAQLRLQDSVAQTLRAVRHDRGALSLETIEPRARFADGQITELRAEPKNRAQELIEDLMIAANSAIARYLASRGLPSLRRVLRSPERWARIVELAEQVRETLPAEPDAAALEAFLVRRKAADPERFPDLSLSIVKLMGRGEYAVERPGRAAEGHFGLAVRDYTHSTAPNRRYPDLVTQRLVKAARAGGGAPYTEAELEGLARHCTEQENAAEKVERRLRKSAAALLLHDRIGERFAGLVTGASAKGTWTRILTPPVEGRVVRGFRGLDVGDHVTVELLSVDVERGFIDFARVS